MEKLNEMILEIEKLTNDLMTEMKNNANGNKSAGRRARKITLTLTKLYKDYRATTLEMEK